MRSGCEGQSVFLGLGNYAIAPRGAIFAQLININTIITERIFNLSAKK